MPAGAIPVRDSERPHLASGNTPVLA